MGGFDFFGYRELLRNDIRKFYETDTHEERDKTLHEIKKLVITQIFEETQDQNLLKDIKDVSANEKFFLWHTWFSDVFENGGFDIVIGNPPYLKEGRANKAIFEAVKDSPYYQGKMDIWYMFACLGLDMLKPDGNLCFIATNNWVTSSGAKKLRQKINTDAQIIQLCDFKDYMIFKTASIQTMIMQFKKNKAEQSYKFDLRNLLGSKLEDVIKLLNKEEASTTQFIEPTYNRLEMRNKFITFSNSEDLFKKIKSAFGIIYLENIESTSDILEISSDETDSFDTAAYRIIYSKDADKKTKRNADLSKGAVIVYNGEVSEKRLSEIIKDFTDGNRYGSIKLIKTAGGGYDLCIVKSYENFVISTVNTDENVYYGKAYSMTELRLNDYERVNVFDSSGNSVSFPTAKDSLVAIAVSENKAYIEAVSCLNTVSGKVSVAKTNENKVTIDNVEYELANQCASENKVDSLLNITIKATLDLNGKIAVIIHQPTDDYKFAYLAKAVAKYDPFGSKPILKLYLPDSVELKDFEFADKTVIDGVSYKSDEIEKLLGAIPGTDVKKSGSDYKIKVSRQLIRYILNSDEKLSRIDTYNLTDGESADNTLTRGHDGETALLYNSSSTRFGMDCIYNSANTKVIFVPQVNADGDVSVGGVAMEETVDMYKGKLNIWNDRSYYAESYKTNHNNYYEDVIVIRMEPSKPDEIAFMFKEVIDAVDENNMPIKQLVGLYGTEVKYELDPQYGDLLGDIEEGDIIMADTDMTGKKAVSITKMFDRGTMTMVNDGKNPYWYANDFDITGNRFRGPRYQLSKSFVYGINNGIVRSTYDFYDMSKNITNEATVASSAAITVYDTSRRGDSVIKGTVSDIKAYESVGENCSVMVSFANYGAIKRIFIYNSK